jgi:hypothetical protein
MEWPPVARRGPISGPEHVLGSAVNFIEESEGNYHQGHRDSFRHGSHCGGVNCSHAPLQR